MDVRRPMVTLSIHVLPANPAENTAYPANTETASVPGREIQLVEIGGSVQNPVVNPHRLSAVRLAGGKTHPPVGEQSGYRRERSLPRCQ